MFWGDIIAAHPKTIKELPEDIICMTWDYGSNPGDTNVRKLWENGAHQYLCPGVQGWGRTIHLLPTAYKNIRKMAEYAHKFSGEGLLTTDWGDYGHFQNPELAVVGIIYGACFGWNSNIKEREELDEDISVIEYGDKSKKLLAQLSRAENYMMMHWCVLVDYVESYRYKVGNRTADEFLNKYLQYVGDVPTQTIICNEGLNDMILNTAKLLVEIEEEKRKRIAPILHMAVGQILFNKIFAVIVEKSKSGAINTEETKNMAAELETWYYEYRKQWHKISRESELYRIGEVIFWVADYLRELK